MNALAKSSRIVASDLRRAETSINNAMRDTAQFLLTTLDVTESHGLAPALLQRTVKATVAALNALTESQDQMSMRAHPSAERAGTRLGLDATSWGESGPKPSVEVEEAAPRLLA